MREEGGRRLNVSGVLRILGVSRSGYYYFKATESTKTKREQRKQELMELIRQIHAESKSIYGAPKITQELRKQGWTVSERTVGNYMREMSLRAHYAHPYTVTTDSGDFDSTLQNLLNDEFSPDQPNAVWCSDITYISTEDGFCYLTSIMDLYSRRILAWQLSDTLQAKWIVNCIHEARAKRRGMDPLILHADRGSQYVSQVYLEALDTIAPSYSQKASPWQNACIESFHALIKREWIYRFDIRDYEHAYKLVFEYIEAFYNTIRSHSHCGFLSPMEFEKQYYEKLELAAELAA
jgi:transposase InsO family protein